MKALHAHQLTGEPLGDLIRSLRTEACMSQQELGELVGLGRTSITNIECGRQVVTTGTLGQIAYALGYDLRVTLIRLKGRI